MEVVLKALFSHGAAQSGFRLLGYIDPSTGSLIFQAVAASIISAGLFINGLRDRIIWLITIPWHAKLPASTTPLPDPAAETTGDT